MKAIGGMIAEKKQVLLAYRAMIEAMMNPEVTSVIGISLHDHPSDAFLRMHVWLRNTVQDTSSKQDVEIIWVSVGCIRASQYDLHPRLHPRNPSELPWHLQALSEGDFQLLWQDGVD